MGELSKVLSGGQLAGGIPQVKERKMTFMQQIHKH